MKLFLTSLSTLTFLLWVSLTLAGLWFSYIAWRANALIFALGLGGLTCFFIFHAFKAWRDICKTVKDPEFQPVRPSPNIDNKKTPMKPEDVLTVERILSVLDEVGIAYPTPTQAEMIRNIEADHYREKVTAELVFFALCCLLVNDELDIKEFTAIPEGAGTSEVIIRDSIVSILASQNIFVTAKNIELGAEFASFPYKGGIHKIQCEYHYKYFSYDLLEGLAKLCEREYKIYETEVYGCSLVVCITKKQVHILNEKLAGDKLEFSEIA